MTISWKEVSPYSGRPVDEDAPTNFAGQGSGVAMPPDAMLSKKKKKKTLIDARTKAYRKHRQKLDAAREKRAKQKSALVTKVQENTMDFNREVYLEENNMNILKDIVVKKQMKPVKFKDGTMKVDLFTASVITQVYNKVNTDNKKKLEKMVNGTKGQFMVLQNKIMKMVGK